MTRPQVPTSGDARPWYRRVTRWGQTNLNELDPERYNDAAWRRRWRESRTQGVIVNAGGIVSFYPSAFPEQYRASRLGSGDLYGDIVASARQEGITVLARMDSNRVHEGLFQQHPDWFCRDVDGEPFRLSGLYVACLNGGYYSDYLPEVFREVVDRSAPDGFADNGWAGHGRDRICYCENCREWFSGVSGRDLPPRPDWDDDAYVDWLEASFARRLEQWDRNTARTTELGGEDCIWVGMINGEAGGQIGQLHDVVGIARRTPIILLDHQSRAGSSGFHGNTTAGQALHQIAGWDILIPESTAHYDGRHPVFRFSAKPAAEVRLWSVAGFAGGVQHWWHQLGSETEDRRRYAVGGDLPLWHAEHEEALVARRPLHRVGIGWSRRNHLYSGRDDAATRVVSPRRGMERALMQHRIPAIPLCMETLPDQDFDGDVIVLPDVAVVTEEEALALERFVAGGGGIVATGRAGTLDGRGRRHATPILDRLLGIERLDGHEGDETPGTSSWDDWTRHTYLRLHRDRADSDLFDGLDGTDLVAFGGRMEKVRSLTGAPSALGFVPGVPRFPVELSWIEPGFEDGTAGDPLVLTEAQAGRGRVAYLAADLDRSYERDGTPDHGRILASLTAWAAASPAIVGLEGPGIVALDPYRTGDSIVVHLVNHSSPGDWRAPVTELLPIGPHTLTLATGDGRFSVRTLVGGTEEELEAEDGVVTVVVPRIDDHEVVVVRGAEVGMRRSGT